MLRVGFVLLCGWGLLCGCSAPHSDSDLDQWSLQSDKLKILSTLAVIDDVVEAIGGERVIHVSLILGDIDPHSYELVKGDGEKMGMADLVFYNGLGLEHGASLQYQLKNHPRAVAIGDEILARFPDKKIMDKQQVDPHIWMDISLWSEAVHPIVQALIEQDPDGEEFYLDNAQRLREKMKKAHDEIYQSLQEIPEQKRYLVTSHDAFNYFARAYLAQDEEVASGAWKVRFDAPEGFAPEGQLSASDIQQVIAYLLKHQVGVVFPESNISQDSLKKVIHACAQKGLVVSLSKEVLYGDAMGETTYLKMIQHNASVLKQAWESERG